MRVRRDVDDTHYMFKEISLDGSGGGGDVLAKHWLIYCVCVFLCLREFCVRLWCVESNAGNWLHHHHHIDKARVQLYGFGKFLGDVFFSVFHFHHNNLWPLIKCDVVQRSVLLIFSWDYSFGNLLYKFLNKSVIV